MTVGVLLITHQAIGEALVKTITSTYLQPPPHLDNLCIPLDCDTSTYLQRAITKAQTLDDGDGVLLLSDLFGATPSNIAINTSHALNASLLVCGINLPMLLRVINYANKPLKELADIAVEGGKAGVTLYPNCQEQT